jgi:hypothetical protein
MKLYLHVPFMDTDSSRFQNRIWTDLVDFSKAEWCNNKKSSWRRDDDLMGGETIAKGPVRAGSLDSSFDNIEWKGLVRESPPISITSESIRTDLAVEDFVINSPVITDGKDKRQPWSTREPSLEGSCAGCISKPTVNFSPSVNLFCNAILDVCVAESGGTPPRLAVSGQSDATSPFDFASKITAVTSPLLLKVEGSKYPCQGPFKSRTGDKRST